MAISCTQKDVVVLNTKEFFLSFCQSQWNNVWWDRFLLWTRQMKTLDPTAKIHFIQEPYLKKEKWDETPFVPLPFRHHHSLVLFWYFCKKPQIWSKLNFLIYMCFHLFSFIPSNIIRLFSSQFFHFYLLIGLYFKILIFSLFVKLLIKTWVSSLPSLTNPAVYLQEILF